MSELKCRFSYCIFDASETDPDNGYTVCQYTFVSGDGNKLKKGDRFIAVGYYLSKFDHSLITLEGEWSYNSKKGQYQFAATSCSEEIETDEDSIISFLSSPLIKGIGEAKARRIYTRFGKNTLDVIENTPDELYKVIGLSDRNVEQLLSSYKEVSNSRELITFLAQYGITPATVQVLNQKYEVTYNKVKTNPYCILKCRNINFFTADKIAIALNLPMNFPERIKAGLFYIIYQNESYGHVGMVKDLLVKKTAFILNKSSSSSVTTKEIQKSIDELIQLEQLVPVSNLIFRRKPYDWETNVAKNIIRLMKTNVEPIIDLDEKIETWQKENDVCLDGIQIKAVKQALNSGFSIITGGPGRGKTTVCRCIVDIRTKHGKTGSITLLAPTGRAASRLSEATGKEASTIHHHLQLQGGESDDVERAYSSINTEQLLVDEVSMLDNWLANILFSSILDATNVTLIGDPDQLPSVGAGLILKNLIESNIVPVVALEKIYRQKDGSVIITNAENIRTGNSKDLIFNSTDFKAYYASNGEEAAKYMKVLYCKAVKEYDIDNVILLSPFHHAESLSSVDSMNTIIQNTINGYHEKKDEYKSKKIVFRVNDQVMQTKNENDVSNGDIGYIKSIEGTGAEVQLTVQYPNTTVTYDKKGLNSLELAYCMSIHKSQGSEAKCVIINLMDEHSVMLKRNLFYTAVTRASKEVIFVGQKTAIDKAIATIDCQNRITLLNKKLQKLYNLESVNNNPFLIAE